MLKFSYLSVKRVQQFSWIDFESLISAEIKAWMLNVYKVRLLSVSKFLLFSCPCQRKLKKKHQSHWRTFCFLWITIVISLDFSLSVTTSSSNNLIFYQLSWPFLDYSLVRFPNFHINCANRNETPKSIDPNSLSLHRTFDANVDDAIANFVVLSGFHRKPNLWYVHVYVQLMLYKSYFCQVVKPLVHWDRLHYKSSRCRAMDIQGARHDYLVFLICGHLILQGAFYE